MSRLSIVALLTAVSLITLSGCTSNHSRESAQPEASKGASLQVVTQDAEEKATSNATATATAKPTAPPVSTSGKLSAANAKLLTFSGETIDGTAYSSEALLTGPAVLWFYTPWCAICRNEGAAMSGLAAKYAGKVNFVAIGANGAAEEMREFAQTTKTISITHLNDANLSLWNRFGVVIQPSHVFVNSTGKVETSVGPIDHDLLAQKIARLSK